MSALFSNLMVLAIYAVLIVLIVGVFFGAYLLAQKAKKAAEQNASQNSQSHPDALTSKNSGVPHKSSAYDDNRMSVQ